MRLASYRANGRSTYGAVLDGGIVDLGALFGAQYPDLRSLLAADAVGRARLAAQSRPADHRLEHVEWLPVIPNPAKIICVGLNYEEHRLETGREKSAHPSLFTRYADTQVGAGAPLIRPRESERFDYEVELAVIIGKPGRRISETDAWTHIAGYSIYNDASVRDFQHHTGQWTPGKNFPGTGAFGPWMVTADEIPPATELALSTRLNGKEVQRSTTTHMIFGVAELIRYISTFTRLEAGDVIATGTPGGVGARRTPPLWMKDGDTVELEIERIGVLRNSVADE